MSATRSSFEYLIKNAEPNIWHVPYCAPHECQTNELTLDCSNRTNSIWIQLLSQHYVWLKVINHKNKTKTPSFPPVLAAPTMSEATTSPLPLRTTTATTTTTTVHRGVSNTTATIGLKGGNKGAPNMPPQTTSPPTTQSLPLPVRFCEATEKRDIMWPQTQRGMLVERPCPKGTRGKQDSFSPQGLALTAFMWPKKTRESDSLA